MSKVTLFAIYLHITYIHLSIIIVDVIRILNDICVVVDHML
jgi:hypothetical protein